MQSGKLTGNNIDNGKRHIKYIYDTEGIQIVEIGDNAYRLVKDIFNNVVMVMNHDNASLECIYRYDAFGNCTVLDKYGKVDYDSYSVGNTNPIRWKSFYYDTETGYYYANGSYYDPSTGTYLDASPISTIFDNVAALTNLDRNAPVCNNILELAGNPYTVATASNLSPDPTYDPNANAPWYVIVRNWIRNTIYRIIKWLNDLSPEVKKCIGVAFLALAVLFATAADGPIGALNVIVFVALGTLEGMAMWMVVSWYTRTPITQEGLYNAAIDSFLITSAFVFISTSVNAIKVLARSKPVTTAELAECVGQCFIAGTLVHCEDGLKKIEDVQVGDKVLAYNEETGEQAYKTVLHIFRNESKDWIGITVNDKEIVSTPGHKYYLPLTKQWVSAQDLKVGDTVLLSNGQLAKVQKTHFIHYDTPQTTYNFEVEDFHTYYVETGVLVHNKKCNIELGDNYLYQNGVEVRVNPSEGIGNVPHNTPHAHVEGQGPSTTVGLDRMPMKGHSPLSRKQIKVVNNNWDYIEKIIRKVWP